MPFRPSVGGIETVSALLAERFQRLGHQVVLVTQTAYDGVETEDFEVVRRPGAQRLIALVRWADVVFHNNISLRLAWPQLLLRRPWVVAHHTWIPAEGLAGRLKRFALRYASNIAVSQAVADNLQQPCKVVPNPYADDVFKLVEGVERDKELVFVGRLVSDKGVNVLLDALGMLALRGRRPRLTVIGDGPELATLKLQAVSLGIEEQVAWVGRRSGHELVEALHRHRVLVVPSVWEEPFGIVALEAIACGCVPLVARSGGLPEAVGRCGIVFRREDRQALAYGIDELLVRSAALERCRRGAVAHLERHTRDRVAKDYLAVLSEASRTHANRSHPHAA